MEFKDDKQLEKQKMEEIDAMPIWLRNFYDAFDPFLFANGWEKFKGCYVYAKALMEPEWALWTFEMPTNLEGIRQTNYNLLKALGDCPIQIDGYPVLYFDVIDGRPIAFYQFKNHKSKDTRLDGSIWDTRFEDGAWRKHTMSNNEYTEYFLTKLGYGPIL